MIRQNMKNTVILDSCLGMSYLSESKGAKDVNRIFWVEHRPRIARIDIRHQDIEGLLVFGPLMLNFWPMAITSSLLIKWFACFYCYVPSSCCKTGKYILWSGTRRRNFLWFMRGVLIVCFDMFWLCSAVRTCIAVAACLSHWRFTQNSQLQPTFLSRHSAAAKHC